MTTKTVLLPCPFCLTDEFLVVDESAAIKELFPRTVRCNKCCAFGPIRSNSDEAVAAWNTRPLPPARAVPEGLIKALQYQEQLDADGVMVGVSRQALDELMACLTTPAEPARTVGDEREAFEQAAQHKARLMQHGEAYLRKFLLRLDDGEYSTRWVQEMWDGWQARALLAAAPAEAPENGHE